jgi:hypothetical protein
VKRLAVNIAGLVLATVFWIAFILTWSAGA